MVSGLFKYEHNKKCGPLLKKMYYNTYTYYNKNDSYMTKKSSFDDDSRTRHNFEAKTLSL